MGPSALARGGRERGRRLAAEILRRLPGRLGRSLLVATVLVGPFVFTLRGWLRLLALQKLGASARRSGMVALGVRAWDGGPLWVRPGGTDWETAHASLIGCYHRAPADLAEVRTILDLGANIGATVADLAAAHPGARVLGVEPDGANVAIARRNVECWGGRASIIQGAVWTEDGEIAYGGDRGEWAYRVLPAMDERTDSAAIATVPAFSMTTLIDMLAPDGAVDYVKMDVEGAERFLLNGSADWAGRVRCLQVEVHAPWTMAACRSSLEGLGFDTTGDERGILSVTAHRRG